MFGIDQTLFRTRSARILGGKSIRLWSVVVVVVVLVGGGIVLSATYLDRHNTKASHFAGRPPLDTMNIAAGDAELSGARSRESGLRAAAAENRAHLHGLPINEASVPMVGNFLGNGVRVGNSFHILTTRHVALACPRLIVIDQNGLPHDATLVAEDRTNELALIEAETLPPSGGISSRGFRSQAFDEPVWYVRSAALRGAYQEKAIVSVARIADLTRRNASRLVTLINDQRGNGPAFLVGDSGGPVTDTDGRLAGIIDGKLPTSRAHTTELGHNIGFMINVGLTELFLHANGVDDVPHDDKPDDPAPQPRDILEYTVEVQCNRRS